MTPEFGAPSQLEKIDMLDFADLVARADEEMYRRKHTSSGVTERGPDSGGSAVIDVRDRHPSAWQ